MRTISIASPGLELIEPPAWMSALDELPGDVPLVHVRAMSHVGPSADAAIVPRASRPFLGDALKLAETALVRRDALDAAAQFRALLSYAPSEAAPYLEIQLSRAYVSLERFDEAEAILRARVAVNTSAAWPAVYELAALLVRYRNADAYETWEWLAPHAGPLRGELARYLWQIDPSSDALAYADAVDARPPADLIDACTSALAAFHAAPPKGLPSWDVCPSRDGLWGGVAPDAHRALQLQRIARQVRVWKTVVASNDAEQAWLRVAQDLTETADLDPATPTAKLASWLALLAYQNAASIAAMHGGRYTVSAEEYRAVRTALARLHPSMQAPAQRLVDSFLRSQP